MPNPEDATTSAASQQQQQQQQQHQDELDEGMSAGVSYGSQPTASTTVTAVESSDGQDEEVDLEEREQYKAAAAAAAAAAGAQAFRNVADAVATIQESLASGLEITEEEATELQIFYQGMKWLDEPDPSDPIVKSHYRKIWSFTAGDPVPLVPGKEGPGVRVWGIEGEEDLGFVKGVAKTCTKGLGSAGFMLAMELLRGVLVGWLGFD
jgi:hypothetical protein